MSMLVRRRDLTWSSATTLLLCVRVCVCARACACTVCVRRAAACVACCADPPPPPLRAQIRQFHAIFAAGHVPVWLRPYGETAPECAQ